MLEKMLIWERDLFFSMNGSDSSFLDSFMWLYTGKAVWLPLAVFIIIVIAWKRGWKQTLLFLLSVALVVTLCDQFASHICKPLFTRFRPTHHPDFMNDVKTVFDYRGGLYGFISSHAANAFGFATLTILIFRNRLYTLTIIIWAIITAYSRIYLGVHFITDIIFGTLAGIMFGIISYFFYAWLEVKWLHSSWPLPCQYSIQKSNYISYAIWITIVSIAILYKPLISLLLK